MTPSMLPWDVLTELKSLYQQVRTINGYLTNIGENVSLENSQTADESLPDLVITAQPAVAGTQGKAFRVSKLQVFLESRVPASRQAVQNTAWRVLADLMAATPTRADPLPNGAMHIEVESAGIIQRPDGQPFVVAQIVLSVGLLTT